MKKKEPTSPRLKELLKDLIGVEKAEKYLEKERKKLRRLKERVRIKIKKEKKIIILKNRIKRLKG